MAKKVGVALLLLWAGGLYAWSQPAIILSISFQGNDSIDAARLKGRLRICREGAWYSPEALKFELLEVEKLYQDSGFLEAKVGPPKVERKDAEGRSGGVALLIPVEEGAQFKLARLSILDAKVLNTDTLLQMSPLRTGQAYSRGMIIEWLERIRASYNEMGHIRFEARIREDIRESERAVDCELIFKEGGSYRVGKISVGSVAIDLTDFKKRLLVGEGAVYNPDMLAYTIQFLNMRRAYRPFGPSDVEVRIDDSTGTVDLVFHVAPLTQSGPKPPESSRHD
jgi:outer membrane protein assembly factor BamA